MVGGRGSCRAACNRKAFYSRCFVTPRLGRSLALPQLASSTGGTETTQSTTLQISAFASPQPRPPDFRLGDFRRERSQSERHWAEAHATGELTPAGPVHPRRE